MYSEPAHSRARYVLSHTVTSVKRVIAALLFAISPTLLFDLVDPRVYTFPLLGSHRTPTLAAFVVLLEPNCFV